MKRNIFLGIAAVIIFLILLMIVNNLKSANNGSKKVCFNDNCFEVELAVSLEERQKGLMFRENLAAEKGMLFIFEEEGNHAFWMKNTFIPLDIIWINEKKEVVFISYNTQPCEIGNPCQNIAPGKKAKYVLEIQGGLSQKIGLLIGSKLEFLNIE